jgi:hypothetical protein
MLLLTVRTEAETLLKVNDDLIALAFQDRVDGFYFAPAARLITSSDAFAAGLVIFAGVEFVFVHGDHGEPCHGEPCLASKRHWGVVSTRCFAQRQIGVFAHLQTHGTKVPKCHSKSIHCRVRRKRQRLTSNGSIESNAAINTHLHPNSLSPRHFR